MYQPRAKKQKITKNTMINNLKNCKLTTKRKKIILRSCVYIQSYVVNLNKRFISMN